MAVTVPLSFAFLATSAGYDELWPWGLLMIAITALWLCLAWAVAQIQQGRARRIHVAVSVGLAAVGAAISFLPTLIGPGSDEVTVSRVLPPH